MRTRRGRVGAESQPAALLHVILRSCRSGPLVRDERDWLKMTESIDSMLFWCGGRVFACRCEADRIEFAMEAAEVPLGRMFRYLTVPYALHFNRSRGSSGRVFKRLRAFKIRRAFRTEFVLWLHRPLSGEGWTADAAYQSAQGLPWVDAAPILEQLGRGPGAFRQYRLLRARGVDEELRHAFASLSATTRGIRERYSQSRALRERQRQELLRAVVLFVARHETLPADRMRDRSSVRRISRARALVTLVAVRCGISVKAIAQLLARDESTLQEVVLRLRSRDSRGLMSAVEALLAQVRARRQDDVAQSDASSASEGGEVERGEAPEESDDAQDGEPAGPDRSKDDR